MKENWRPGKLERRIQEFARNTASKQLLRVPYEEFAKATRQYVRWEAFTLWIRAVLQSEDEVPAVAREALQERLASFVKNRHPFVEPALLNQQLDEWIRARFFREARREGWFEAILFYSVRDAKLKYVYAYWEQCERDWADKRMRRYPEFGAWLESACKCGLFPVNAHRFAKAVDGYLDWVALAYWLDPLLEHDRPIPPQLVAELKKKGRGFCELAKQLEEGERRAVATRFHLMNWIENRYFSDAQEQEWLESLRRCAQNHPKYARISEYARRWRAQQPQKRPRRYPSFINWYRDAQSFVDVR